MRSVVVASVLVIACAPPAAPDWPMFRSNVARTGFAAGSVMGPEVERVWEIPAFNVTRYSAVKGSPAVVDGVVYCGNDTSAFVAARASDGRILWQVRLEGAVNGIHGSPAVAGDTVYIGAYDGTLHALDRATGAPRWRRTIGFAVGASPAVLPSMVISAHELPDGTGRVVALDARTGATRWQQVTAAHPHSSVAIDTARSLVVIGDNAGTVYAFDARTGLPRWRHALARVAGHADVKTTPTVISELGLVVIAAWSGRIIALHSDTGRIAWQHELGGKLMGSTAYVPDTVFAGSPSGRFVALDAATGRLRWARDLGARIYSSPAISGDGRAVVFGSGSRVYALATADGREIWSIDVGGRVSGSPVLVGRRIYITAQHGGLVALETALH